MTEPNDRPAIRISAVTLGAGDPVRLARFYADLLGYRIVEPTWPTEPDRQQMMLHLEIQVDDLRASTAHALNYGARLAAFQPQEDVRVCLDPAGRS